MNFKDVIQFFRADGGCRHIAAALYELENYIRTCASDTDMPCVWSKKSRPTDEPLLAKEISSRLTNFYQVCLFCIVKFYNKLALSDCKSY